MAAAGDPAAAGHGDGLTPQQLEAVLAHELAHVRRHDYVVNIFQMVVETLFFYHPAVWWTSRRLRVERELCCDDLAVQSCGDAAMYARALATLEQMRATRPSLAMAAAQGSLVHRIQRLLPRNTRDYGPSRWPGVLAIVIALACAALNVNWVGAQTQTERPSFEVASVKPNTSGGGLVSLSFPGGRFTATNATLPMLLRQAYGLQDFQMSGGPAWMTSERFDIVAKAEGAATVPQMRLMLRTLLADRFKMNARIEMRDLPVYALVVARNDGRLGSGLKPAGDECRPITLWAGAPPPPPAPPGPPQSSRSALQCPSMLMPGNLSARKLSTARLAETLSQWVNRIVLDRTGTTGDFDFDLRWTPDQVLPTRPGISDAPGAGVVGGPGPELAAARAPVDSSGPSLFSALQEQLGLKLESQRGPVEILVIDSLERPTQD